LKLKIRFTTLVIISLLALVGILTVALLERNRVSLSGGGIKIGGEGGDTGGGGDGGGTGSKGIVFLNGADGISKIGSPYATISVKYYPGLNWTASSALLIKNLDETPHAITITYESTTGDMSNVAKMYCYVYAGPSQVMFYGYYDGENKVTSGTWNSLAGGDILTLKISTLGFSESGSFGINFEVTYE
jgi:hypothetical protein